MTIPLTSPSDVKQTDVEDSSPPEEEDWNDIVPMERRLNDIPMGGEVGQVWKQKDGAAHGTGRCLVDVPDQAQTIAQTDEHPFVDFDGIKASALKQNCATEREVNERPSQHSCDEKSSVSSRRVTEVSVCWARTPNWKAKVRELSQRAVSLEDLFSFYQRLGNKNGLMPHFDPLRSTTNDVVRSAIIPESSHACCALATVFNNGQPKTPQKMVTHHWSNRFSHTFAAIVSDALELPTYESIVERLVDKALCEQLKEELREFDKLSLSYWFCAVSVNQHCSICGDCTPGRTERDSVTNCIIDFCGCGLTKHFFGDACEMNKFNEMMALLCKQVPSFGQVVVVDECFEIFSRAWCVAEIVEAHQSGMPQFLKMHSVASLKAHSQMVKCLDVRDCRASRVEDKDAILAGIENIDAFNHYLHELLLGRHNGLLVETYHLLAGYTLWWDGFSNEYLLQLSQRGHHILPLCMVLVIPTLVSFVFMIFPLRFAGQDWQEQSLFFIIFVPLFGIACITYFPCWLTQFSGMELDSTVRYRLLAWIASCTTAMSIAVFCCAVAMDTFPVPWCLVVMATVNVGFQSLMWMCASAHQRRKSKFNWRFVYAMASCIVCIFTFGMVFPFLTVVIGSVSTVWQMALVFAFLASKLLFEHMGRVLARRNTADTMPMFILLGSYSYEINMCMIFCGGFDWMIFIELVSFDAVENLFHLWSLVRARHRSLKGDSSKLQEHSGRHVYIVSVLIVRELCEVIIPAQFLAILSLTRLIQPRFIDLVCDMSDFQFRQAQIFLATDICVELLLASLTYVALKYCGFRPFHLLCSLASKEFLFMSTWGSAALTYFLCQHHSHFGMDLEFKFNWLQNEHAEWTCGLIWNV